MPKNRKWRVINKFIKIFSNFQQKCESRRVEKGRVERISCQFSSFFVVFIISFSYYLPSYPSVTSVPLSSSPSPLLTTQGNSAFFPKLIGNALKSWNKIGYEGIHVLHVVSQLQSKTYINAFTKTKLVWITIRMS